MKKAQLKLQSAKVIALARVAASFTPTTKDDDAVELIAHLFEDAEHFDVICRLLDITE